MKLWGLTGGIASGKSTVARLFAELGAHVLDADAIYHQLLAPQEGAPSALAAAVAQAFAPLPLLGGDGTLLRQVLAQHVFADQAARRRLEALTHPAVARRSAERSAELAEAGAEHILYDVPLLFENNLAENFSGVVLSWVPRPLQLQRLCARDHIDPQKAELRLAAQLDLDTKRQKATWVIDNSGTEAHTAAQVATVWQAMHR